MKEKLEKSAVNNAFINELKALENYVDSLDKCVVELEHRLNKIGDMQNDYGENLDGISDSLRDMSITLSYLNKRQDLLTRHFYILSIIVSIIAFGCGILSYITLN